MSIPVQTLETWYRSTLSAKLNATDVTVTVATAPTVTSGRMHVYKGNTHAWIKYTGVSWTTLTGVTFVSQTADPITTVTGTTFPAGTSIELVEMHDQSIDKTAPTYSNQIATTYATTAARDTALGGDGAALYPYVDIYVTATWLHYNYNMSANEWQTVETWTTTPNSSTTVAGKVETATTAQSIAATDVGETGANLMVLPSDIAKNTQSGTFVYGADAGGDDAYVVALTPALTAYTTGQILTMKVATANTGACTVDFWPWVKNIKMPDGTDPINGAVTGTVQLLYDGTNFILITPIQDFLSINTRDTDPYYTRQVPLNATMTGWTNVNIVITENAGSYTALSWDGAWWGQWTSSTILPGTWSTDSYTPAGWKTFRMKSRMRFIGLSTDRAWFGFTSSAIAIHLAQTDTTTHAAKFVNNWGVLYAVTSNAVAATATNVTGSYVLSDYNMYAIVFTPTAQALFYINGTLVATHTTNLPTSGSLMAVWVNANSRAINMYPPILSIQL